MHININIDNLTEDELLALNRRVIARLVDDNYLGRLTTTMLAG